MPFYKVWYKDNEEPLEFSTAGRYSEEQIVEHLFAHEQIAAPAPGSTLKERIAGSGLAPVRYTEDESEISIIG
ncbi:hypothetical protein GJ697_01735 [Pseudoduganella sp. FT25W]|uniref:Uncharacterized protein n=1 Tax=Duganella alba TaxID=2666081 RepID=A0A6L5QB58_9BURK|nr:hypothetical protein [Duganella alba]MRX06552.1 hypothetical protein [Duganella alba]MRX14946.1 hypothetical protein [Duganella alba]